MKKTNILFGILAVLAFAVSCETKIDIQDNPVEPLAEQVTITASIPDGGLTKVSLTPAESGGKPILKLAWEDDDEITVNGETFTIVPASITGEGKIASFAGSDPGAGPYNIVYSDLPGDLSNQTQSADNNADHLGYAATLTGVDEYASIEFASSWASSHGGTFSQAGALLIQAKLPTAAIADAVKKVIIRTTDNSLNGANTLTVNLGTSGVDGDGQVINIYATLSEAATLAADSELFIDFQVSANAYDKYTAYRKLAASKVLEMGKLNEFKLNCEHINQYAGTSDTGTALNPYLIGDQHQMNAIRDLLVADKTLRYFKMIDDINMTGITWVPLNNVADGSSEYSKYISFDGNVHTLSNLTTKESPSDAENYPSVFGVLNGSVTNLIIDHATIYPGDRRSGVLAGYIGSGDCTVTPSVSNIVITNSTVGTSEAKGTYTAGALCAMINKAGTTISNITVTNCTVANTVFAGGMICEMDAETTINGTNTVTNTNVYGSLAGGVIGFANARTTMSGCTFKDGTITGTARYVGGMLGSTGDFESTISGCSVQNATMSGAADRVGGFVGLEQKKVTISNCYVSGGSVSAKTINVGGFAGVGYGTIENSYVDGTTVSSSNSANKTNVGLGGFVGYLSGSLTGCHSSVSIDQVGSYIGGLVGYMLPGGSINKCFATGNVTGIYRQVGGLVGGLASAGIFSIQNSYATGNIQANSYVGGLIGEVYSNITNVTISNCFCSGTVTATSFGGGGLIGYVSAANIAVEKCAAWNPSVTAGSTGSDNWSSAAVVGVAFPTCTLTDNYRNPAMTLTAYWVPAADYNHPDVSSAHPLVKQDGTETTATSTSGGQDGYPQFPYHGKVESGKTLSQLASTTLGWSSEVWDFTAALPVLK